MKYAANACQIKTQILTINKLFNKNQIKLTQALEQRIIYNNNNNCSTLNSYIFPNLTAETYRNLKYHNKRKPLLLINF